MVVPMSSEGFSLSDLMVHYPFSSRSRQFFEKLSIEDSFASDEVLKQAENRLLSSVGRMRYDSHISELIEFSSFFVAALVASQDTNLAMKFSGKEADRARVLFIKERAEEKPSLIRGFFGFDILPANGGVGEYRFFSKVENYLSHVVKHELHKLERRKLVNQTLSNGMVYFTDNSVNDLFRDFAQGLIYDGVRNMRKGSFPKELVGLRDRVLLYLPPPKVRSGKGYLYIEELLKHPVSDGRHRLVWLVLAPYFVNVKQVGEAEAIEAIRAFVVSGGSLTTDMKRFIEYNVRRSKRSGLMPPTLNKLKAEHPDLYQLLPKGIPLNYPERRSG